MAWGELMLPVIFGYGEPILECVCTAPIVPPTWLAVCLVVDTAAMALAPFLHRDLDPKNLRLRGSGSTDNRAYFAPNYPFTVPEAAVIVDDDDCAT